ncbi:hypothetical protein ACFWGP_05610 [Agromyces sp. NPDC127015]|uniref:hypothetical protein n=1 Tax=Agromyces sp. NPDC127015 TaxID=3347108 RepID=UPI0036649E34
MALKTRRPSGKPTWHITLLTGKEKVGKSHWIAEASACRLIHRTFWLPVGELDPDEYGIIPGADFEIIEHDGTLEDIIYQLTEAVMEDPGPNGEPNLIAVDSAGLIWTMLVERAQAIADARVAARHGGEIPEGMPVEIPSDVWTRTRKQWGEFMRVLRMHHGPVLLTARTDTITLNGVDGERSADKVKAEKNLVYDVDSVIEMPTRGELILSGVRSGRLKLDGPQRSNGLKPEGFWTLLGLDQIKAEPRRFTELRPAAGIEP